MRQNSFDVTPLSSVEKENAPGTFLRLTLHQGKKGEMSCLPSKVQTVVPTFNVQEMHHL